MQIKKLVSVMAMAGVFCVTSVHATGIPVIDVANLANSISQVIAWGGQSGQMVEQIQQYAQQIQQMQNMTTKFDAARNLGTILNNPAIRSMLPPEMQNANQILSSAISGNQQAAVNSILAAYSIPVTANPQLGQGSALMISNMQSVLASGQARQVQLDQLASRVDSSPDAKSSLDLLNRNVIESANASNQLMQTIASIEANREANRLRALANDEARLQAILAAQRASR
ncbi:MAG: type IV secretion system protein [Burkholderiaceae bacterium]|nr:type IV secretion system protein [Burkholderiaceae bacterium]